MTVEELQVLIETEELPDDAELIVRLPGHELELQSGIMDGARTGRPGMAFLRVKMSPDTAVTMTFRGGDVPVYAEGAVDLRPDADGVGAICTPRLNVRDAETDEILHTTLVNTRGVTGPHWEDIRQALKNLGVKRFRPGAKWLELKWDAPPVETAEDLRIREGRTQRPTE